MKILFFQFYFTVVGFCSIHFLPLAVFYSRSLMAFSLSLAALVLFSAKKNYALIRCFFYSFVIVILLCNTPWFLHYFADALFIHGLLLLVARLFLVGL